MNAAVTANAKVVLDYLVAHDGEDLTAQTITDAVFPGEKKNKVDAIVTGLAKRKLVVREVADTVVIDEKGKPHTIKYIRATDEGKSYNHDAALQADADAKVEAAKAKAAAKEAKEEA